MKRIAVFCGSGEGNNKDFVNLASELGSLIGDLGLGLVYGGASIGMMGALADAALKKGTDVWGIMPKYFMEGQWQGEIAHKGLTHFEVTDDMHLRKSRMYELSDCFITLPGGLGTMDEFFEIATWRQIELHKKPCYLFNHNGYYNHLINHIESSVKSGLMADSVIKIFDNIQNLMDDFLGKK